MTDHASPLFDTMVGRGGVVGDYHGRPLVRHFGDPAGEYRSATEGVAVFDRSHRIRLHITGRGPAKMLQGVLTGVMPTPASPVSDGVLGGRGSYHAVLTPKGKMVSDLWAFALEAGDSGSISMDVPVVGAPGLRDLFTKVLPPRFAAVEDVSEATAAITVVGPEAAAALSRLALGLRVGSEELAGLDEGEWRLVGEDPADGLRVVRTLEVWPEAYTVYGSNAAVAALWKALVDTGAVPAGLGVWSTLRVEAGRPVFGTDMTEDTIPVEAGIHDRAIDYQKGCYTGQEVIIRIRDRGKVNRHLRRLRLGDATAPAKGVELLATESDKVLGWVTSSVESPRFGETIALGYVRAGHEVVRIGDRSVRVETETAD